MGEGDIAKLRGELEAANADLSQAVRALAPKHVGGEMEAYEAAYQHVLGLERRLAAAELRSYAVPEIGVPQWDIGAPYPTLLQSDSRAILLYYLGDDPDFVGIVDFTHCSATTFGSPNDETFEGHPLHGSGFEPYRLMRVVNSKWVASLQQINSVHPRHDPQRRPVARHLIFPFHDSTFECVTGSFETSTEPGPIAAAAARTQARLY